MRLIKFERIFLLINFYENQISSDTSQNLEFLPQRIQKYGLVGPPRLADYPD